MGEGAREEGERGWCARGRAAPASAPDAASGRPETPAVRGGLGRTRAKLRTLPPSRFPSQARGQQGQPRTFNSFLPAPKSGLSRAHRPCAVPADPLVAAPPPSVRALREPAPAGGAPSRGREGGLHRGVREHRGPLAPSPCALPLPLPSYLGRSGEKRKTCWFGISAGKGVDVCAWGGARGGPVSGKELKVSEPRVPWTRAV